MAKVFSHTVFKGSGSVGATYYRKSRGRSILCQKPGERSAEFKGLNSEERCILACISLFSAMHAQSIKNSFNRTKYGTYRNYFMKCNYTALKKAFLVELVPQMLLDNAMPTPEQVEMAIENYAVAHPNEIYRIKKSGYPIVMLEDGWDDADDPIEPPVVTSMDCQLDANFRIERILVEGENLNNSIGFQLKNPSSVDVQTINGTSIVNSAKTSLIFTPSGNYPVAGTKLLQAWYGQQNLKEIEVEGDTRVYHEITISVDPAGAGTVTGAGSYPEGTNAILKATATTGYAFLGWYIDGAQVSTEAQMEVTVNGDMDYLAKFESVATEVSFSLEKETAGSAPIAASALVVKIDGNEIAAGQTTGAGVLARGSHTITIAAVPSGASGDSLSIMVDGDEKASGGAQIGVSYTLNATANFALNCAYIGGF